MFYATRHQIYLRFVVEDMVFASTLIWYQDTQRSIYLHTYGYILTPSVVRAQQLPVLHWMDNLIQKFTSQKSTMSLLFKNYLLVEVIHLLMRFNKTKNNHLFYQHLPFYVESWTTRPTLGENFENSTPLTTHILKN